MFDERLGDYFNYHIENCGQVMIDKVTVRFDKTFYFIDSSDSNDRIVLNYTSPENILLDYV